MGAGKGEGVCSWHQALGRGGVEVRAIISLGTAKKSAVSI